MLPMKISVLIFCLEKPREAPISAAGIHIIMKKLRKN